ncbi:FadR/GntR family transcriptional regulator [Nesterenkonia flava]|uniref:FadR/GntR family transcriptional regulator n=1 Tax=Nesterenkonia flava TaxID=469799 RepID=A0ABU1FVS0_9MICC|nr:FadR/GntR family transcriptional regulator [Nesterenkonia flava]MDR5712767.1 FadR/GntR family transcriptional regulator [Nesterenkonia flava]
MSEVNIPPLPFRSPNIVVTLTAHLEKLIATGELPPGTKLPAERELAQSLAVSRASLREALHDLEAKNLLERRPGRGTHVTEQGEQVHQLRGLASGPHQQNSAAELRGLVEPSVASLAASRATHANLVQLQDVIARSYTATTAQQSLERDIEFHLLLAHASFNPLITTLHGMMTEWTMDLRAHSHATEEGRSRSLRGHEEILAAVEAQDPDRAAEAMRQHLEEVRNLIASENP